MEINDGIDWTALELDFRAGVLPVSAIAKKFGTSDHKIKARAEKYGWERKPLDPFAVQQAHGVSSTTPTGPKYSMDSDLSKGDVQRAAVLQAAAVLDIHRADVKKLRELSGKFTEALSALFVEFSSRPPVDAIDGLQRAMVLLGVLVGDKTPADLLEQLSRVMVRLVTIERQAYGLDVLPLDPNKSGEASEQVQSQVNELWRQIQEVQKSKTASIDTTVH